MSKGKQHSFATLFADVGRVEIPIIQRDYAQGRPQASDIRNRFLAALREALTADNPMGDLNLEISHTAVLSIILVECSRSSTVSSV